MGSGLYNFQPNQRQGIMGEPKSSQNPCRTDGISSQNVSEWNYLFFGCLQLASKHESCLNTPSVPMFLGRIKIAASGSS
jgi:hypothetical protein